MTHDLSEENCSLVNSSKLSCGKVGPRVEALLPKCPRPMNKRVFSTDVKFTYRVSHDTGHPKISLGDAS